MQTDPTERLRTLLAKLVVVEKRRSEAETALKHHQLESKIYRDGLDQFDGDTQLDLGQKLATEERRLIHEAVEAFEESVATCDDICLVTDEFAAFLSQQAASHRSELDASKVQLTVLKERIEYLNSVLGV